MKNSLLSLLLLLTLSASSQYYYKDIVDAKEQSEKMKVYLANKVQTITATGYDPQGMKSTDFNEWQEVDAAQRVLKVTNRTGQNVTRQSYRFDTGNRLTTITDSGGTIKSVSTYSYDNSNRIISISTIVRDDLNDFSETEQHYWQYNAAGKPEKMWRVVNSKDSTEYRFGQDEKGNTGDEQLFRRNVGLDQVYYYYDDENHLTDIVRFDKKLKKLLPDVMFEYDEAHRVIQKTTTLSTATRNYLIWRYIFNEKGLKTKEALFNKQKELTGKIEYSYNFLP